MKHIISALALASIVAVSGCDESATGGPGVNLPESEQANVGLTDDTFTLDMPLMSTNIAQGETAAITIGIDRGNNIDQDVTLRFGNMPAGLSVAPATPVIMHGDEDANVTVSAAADAALGDFVVQVTGQPESGPNAMNELKITVEKP